MKIKEAVPALCFLVLFTNDNLIISGTIEQRILMDEVTEARTIL